ncbi:MAG: hypothetical protein CMF61_02240 [Magnetococcales bacterium]|nr:hypothetical protein [Magnetococcales bacterium]
MRSWFVGSFCGFFICSIKHKSDATAFSCKKPPQAKVGNKMPEGVGKGRFCGQRYSTLGGEFDGGG